MRVVLADDSAFMRNILKKHVTEAGAEVVGEAADGNEAVAKCNELTPDMLFLDIMMPNKTGLEALKEIRPAQPGIKIIMCTSIGQEKVMNAAISAGVADFIVKPFKPEDIKEAIIKHGQ